MGRAWCYCPRMLQAVCLKRRKRAVRLRLRMGPPTTCSSCLTRYTPFALNCRLCLMVAVADVLLHLKCNTCL